MKADTRQGLKEQFLPLLLLLFLTGPPSLSSPVLLLFLLGFGSIFFLLGSNRRRPPPLPTRELHITDGKPPKSNGTVPWGRGACHPKNWPWLGSRGRFGM